MPITPPEARLLTGRPMLILLCGLLACRATPAEPGLDLQRPQVPQGAAVEQGCARLSIRVKGRETITVEDDTVLAGPGGSCAGLRPVIRGVPEFDRTTKRVRLPVALYNNGTASVRPPARLYGWEDSLTIIAPPGLAGNGSAATYLDFLSSDSTLSDTAATFPGAVLWRYDTLLAQGGLAVGDTSGVRWIELAVHSGVHQFEVALHTRAEAFSADTTTPPVPTTIHWPQESELLLATSDKNPSVQYVRNFIGVLFQDSASGASINAFISRYKGTIIGGIGSGSSVEYYILEVPDPGPSFADLDTLMTTMQAETIVLDLLRISYGQVPHLRGRFPIDSGIASTRQAWMGSGNPGTQPLIAVRAPLAWGCETGAYGGPKARVGVLDAYFDTIHRDLESSVTHLFHPGPGEMLSNPGFAAQAVTHGTGVAGILSAHGDNGVDMAGMAWLTDLSLYAFGKGQYLSNDPVAYFQSATLSASALDIHVLNMSMGLGDITDATEVRAIERYAKLFLDSSPKRLIVLAVGDSGVNLSIDSLSRTADTRLSALDRALAKLAMNPLYRDKILFVTGTDEYGQKEPDANSFMGANLIAAPANVLTLTGSAGIAPGHGTSFSAPFASGLAALLWSMDPSLAGPEVTSYILRGAMEPRRDSQSGQLLSPDDIGLPGVYQLDAYGSLTLLARENPNTPICGFPVSTDYSFVTNTGSILVQRDPSAAPVPIITTDPYVRASELSVAQGGRVLSIGDVPFDGSVAVVSYELRNGVWVQGGYTRGYRSRYYLERDTAYVRETYVDQQVCSDQSLVVTIRGPGGTRIQDLNITGGRDPIATCEGSRVVVFSPDGEWAFTRTNSVYRQCASTVGAFIVERRYMVNLSTNAGTEVRPPQIDACGAYLGLPYVTGSDARWSHYGEDAAILISLRHLGGRTQEHQRWVISGAQIQHAGTWDLSPSYGTPSYSPDDIVIFTTESNQGQCERVLRLATDFAQVVDRIAAPCPVPPPYIPNAPPMQPRAQPNLTARAIAAIAPPRAANGRRDRPWKPESIRVN